MSLTASGTPNRYIEAPPLTSARFVDSVTGPTSFTNGCGIRVESLWNAHRMNI
jgi:hypothetical protein